MSQRHFKHRSSTNPPARRDESRSQSGLHVRTPMPGMMLGDRYRLQRRIGAGAMGEVWQALHTGVRTRVAIKTLRTEVAANHEVIARFSREAYLLGLIQSDHVVRVIDFMDDRRLGPALVTEFVGGPSLASILTSRALSVEECVELGIDLVSGLRAIHRAHIVHRDVKPANVLLRQVGEHERRAVFIDLGVSRLVEEQDVPDLTEITTEGRAVGTFEYMAPEQVFNSRSVTPGADLYSVGAILFRASTGRHVFQTTTGWDLLQRKMSEPAPRLDTGRGDRVAKGFEELVDRALAVSPADRYEVADEMLAELSLLRDSARRSARRPVSVPPPAAHQPTTFSSTKHKSRSHVSLATLFGIATLAVGLALGVLTTALHSPRVAHPSPTHSHCELVSTQAQAGGRTTYTLACDE